MGKYKAEIEVFHRTWWAHNPAWSGGLEPSIGESHHVGWAYSVEQAQKMCKQWNAENPEGELSDRAEYRAH